MAKTLGGDLDNGAWHCPAWEFYKFSHRVVKLCLWPANPPRVPAARALGEQTRTPTRRNGSVISSFTSKWQRPKAQRQSRAQPALGSGVVAASGWGSLREELVDVYMHMEKSSPPKETPKVPCCFATLEQLVPKLLGRKQMLGSSKPSTLWRSQSLRQRCWLPHLWLEEAEEKTHPGLRRIRRGSFGCQGHRGSEAKAQWKLSSDLQHVSRFPRAKAYEEPQI
eukprot:4257138-Amphidinium_carterae.2